MFVFVYRFYHHAIDTIKQNSTFSDVGLSSESQPSVWQTTDNTNLCKLKHVLLPSIFLAKVPILLLSALLNTLHDFEIFNFKALAFQQAMKLNTTAFQPAC